MITDYIDIDFPSATLQDNGEAVLELMDDTKSNFIPIVEEGNLIGIISEDQILEGDVFLELKDIDFIKGVFMHKHSHILEVIQLMNKHQMDILPIVENEIYIGAVRFLGLIKFLDKSFSASERGAIVVMELSSNSYSMTEIANILEAEDVKILFAATEFIDANHDLIRVHIKTNRDNLSNIVSHLERHEINVTQVINESYHDDMLKERYDSLMNYLNV